MPPESPGVVIAFGARVVPSRFLVERASVAFSSYQLLCLVASLELAIVVLMAAVCLVELRSVPNAEVGPFEEATIAPVLFFRRLTLRPVSSSDEQ